MIHHRAILLFFFLIVLVLVTAVDEEEENELVSKDLGIPVRKWKNRARRQLQMYELRRQLEAAGGSPDLELLAQFYSDPTNFEEEDVAELRGRELQTQKMYDVVIIGSGWAGLSAGKFLPSIYSSLFKICVPKTQFFFHLCSHDIEEQRNQ